MTLLDAMNVYEKLPPGSYSIDSPLILPPYTVIEGSGVDTIINSYVPKDQYTFVLDRHHAANAATIKNLTINLQNEGANGIFMNECQSVRLSDLLIKYKSNPLAKAGIGINISSRGLKTSSNCILDRITIFLASVGIKFETTNAGPANSNGHIVYGLYCWKVKLGIDFAAGSTNRIIAPSFENIGISMQFKNRSHRNTVTQMREENYRYHIEKADGVDGNLIDGIHGGDIFVPKLTDVMGMEL